MILVLMILAVNYLVKFNVKVTACIALFLVDNAKQLICKISAENLCLAILYKVITIMVIKPLDDRT